MRADETDLLSLNPQGGEEDGKEEVSGAPSSQGKGWGGRMDGKRGSFQGLKRKNPLTHDVL